MEKYKVDCAASSIARLFAPFIRSMNSETNHDGTSRRGIAAWILTLVLMSALTAFLPWLRGRAVVDFPWVWDIGYQWIPFASFVRHCYMIGHFPLWDPHNLCGMPFLAFPHTGSLYIPWVLAHMATNRYEAAAAVDLFLHLSLASVASFTLFRTAIKAFLPAAFCGAVAYTFSGFVFSNINHPPSLHTAAWMAAWYAAGFSLLSRPRPGVFAVTSVSLCAMILGGDVETTVYCALGMAFEVAVRRREGTLDRSGLFALAAGSMAGALLALPGLLPFMELSHLSVRSGESFIPSISLAPMLLVTVLSVFQIPLPREQLSSNNGLDPFYLGAFLILLAVYGLRNIPYARRRLSIFLLTPLYLVIMYAPPFNQLTSQIPVLGGLINPLRIWPVLTLFFLLAAAKALDSWIMNDSDNLTEKVSSGSARPPGTAYWTPFGKAGAVYLVLFGALTALSLIWIRHGLGLRIIFCCAMVAAGVAEIFGRSLDITASRRIRSTLAIILIVLDLYGLALAWLPMTDPETSRPDQRLASLLEDTSGRGRYLIYSIKGIIDHRLPYNLGLRLNADTIDSSSRVPPRDSAHRLGKLYPSLFRYREGKLIVYDQMAVRDPKNLDRSRLELVNLMNVKWIIARYPLFLESDVLELKSRFIDQDLFIYENSSALPRAFITTKGGGAAVSVTRPSPDSLELFPVGESIAMLESREEPYELYVSESWYPGWKAYSTGIEIIMEHDELAFRKLILAGLGNVSMVFTPVSFRTGLWAGFASLFALIIFIVATLLYCRPDSDRT